MTSDGDGGRCVKSLRHDSMRARLDARTIRRRQGAETEAAHSPTSFAAYFVFARFVKDWEEAVAVVDLF